MGKELAKKLAASPAGHTRSRTTAAAAATPSAKTPARPALHQRSPSTASRKKRKAAAAAAAVAAHSDDDSDVVIVREVTAQKRLQRGTPDSTRGAKRARSVAAGTPRRSAISPNAARAGGGGRPLSGDEELRIVDVRGEVATRDLPHPRHACAVHAFTAGASTSNRVCCSQCFCFVCDVKASECSLWGTGAHERHHANARPHAYWTRLRVQARKGEVAVVQAEAASLRPLPEAIDLDAPGGGGEQRGSPQRRPTRPAAVRAAVGPRAGQQHEAGDGGSSAHGVQTLDELLQEMRRRQQGPTAAVLRSSGQPGQRR